MVYKSLKILELLWCRGISCLYEQIYILGLAYEIEYVLTYAGELIEPEFESEYSMFPCNYKGFDCSKGIAKYYEEAMEGLF